MAKVSDTKRHMNIIRRKKMQAKMKKLRAAYAEALGEKAKEEILKTALRKNRFMTRNDFLLIPPEKKVRAPKVEKKEGVHVAHPHPKEEKKSASKK